MSDKLNTNSDKKECPAEEKSFLLDCMKENLAHARHIENERHTFFSLYLVAVSLFLGPVFFPDKSLEAGHILPCAVLLVIHSIVDKMFKRWQFNYNKHMILAKELCEKLNSGTLYIFSDNIHKSNSSDKKWYEYWKKGLSTEKLLMRFIHIILILELAALLKVICDVVVVDTVGTTETFRIIIDIITH